MFKQLKEKESKKLANTIIYAGMFLIVFVAIIWHLGTVGEFLKNLFSVLSPFIWGLLLALVSIKPAMFIENKLPSKIKTSTRRIIGAATSTLILVLIISLVIILALPKLVDSVSSLSVLISKFTSDPSAWIDNIQNSLHLSNNAVNGLYSYSNRIVQSLWSVASNIIPNVLTATVATVSGILNFIIGLIVCLYILIDRRRIAVSLKRLGLVVFNKKNYEKARSIMYLALEKFTNFFSGKILDSLIIGIICFICMMFINKDYAALVSVIVGITNIVPFFGPFIGAIPCAFILLIVEPSQCLIFVLMIVLLQQLDGNVIGPKILGGSVGLSSLWIMFAIIVGGAYFGFFGMLLGVPIFSVIYYVIKEYVDEKLKNKRY